MSLNFGRASTFFLAPTFNLALDDARLLLNPQRILFELDSIFNVSFGILTTYNLTRKLKMKGRVLLINKNWILNMREYV